MMDASGSCKTNARFKYAPYVTVATFALIAAGPIYHLIAFARDSGTLEWMQTAYDEPFYINASMGPLSFGQRTLSQLPAHLMQVFGIANFDVIAVVSGLLLPFLAFAAAWILAGTLTKEAIERACWALALVFGFELFSFNSTFFFSPSLAERLETRLGIPWLFAADPFPYFNLYRTPEPQTTWIVFFLYLTFLVRFAVTLELRWYRIVCAITPLFVICYISVAVSAWLLFLMMSMYSIILLRRPLVFLFTITFCLTTGLLLLAFREQNAQAAAVTVFSSHLPILRASVVLALIALTWAGRLYRRNKWRTDARLALAGICASVPAIVLNQQLLTGKIVYAQQWELYCNYICLVLAFGLLAAGRNASAVLHRRGRAIAAAVILFSMGIVIAAGHYYTYEAFLPTNLLSVVEARAYREAVKGHGPISAVVLTHFWDDSLFRIRVSSAAPVIGGATWMMQHPVLPVDRFRSPKAYIEGNADKIAVGFDALSSQEYDAETLRRELHNELAQGLCWPVAGYFFAPRDCWSRLSNYHVRPSETLNAYIDPIVDRYAEFLRQKRLANDRSDVNGQSRVLVMRRAPIADRPATGLWVYQPLGKFVIERGATTASVYAYLQRPRRRAGQPDHPMQE